MPLPRWFWKTSLKLMRIKSKGKNALKFDRRKNGTAVVALGVIESIRIM